MKPTHLSPGTPVIIDGDLPATVRASYPEGSTSYAFPHVRYDVAGGDKNAAISFDRVEVAGSGVGKVARIQIDASAADPWIGTRKPRPSAIRVKP